MTLYGVLPQEIDANVHDVPDECPICHHAIEPSYVTHYPQNYDAVLYDGFKIVFACPRGNCRAVFVGYYVKNRNTQELKWTLPRAPKKPLVPELVAGVSPRFVEVYTQADAASAHGLDEVAGGGYRKALEVLVKDFLISKGIKDEETVKKMTLHAAIQSLPSEVVKSLARFARLLGNDETHYYRKWADKDIKDVKKYLAATMNALDFYLMHEEGEEEFGKPQ